MSKRNLLLLVGLSFLFCGCPGIGDEDPPAVIVDAPTWIRDIEPMMERYCNECHSLPAEQDAPGQFRLDECEDTEVLGAKSLTDRNLLRMQLVAAPMPPASYARRMSEAEITTYSNWLNNGSPCEGTGGPINNMNNGTNNNNSNNSTNNGTNNNSNNNNGVSQWTQVAGILSQGCGAVNCHGRPGGQGNFEVSTTSTPAEVQLAIEGVPTIDGIQLINPTIPDSSAIFNRMSSTLPDKQMPPPPRDPLPEVEILLVRQWILDGAIYE